MIEIPQDAMPVVEVLRQEVKRPEGPITREIRAFGSTVWMANCIGGKCPLGWRKEATRAIPIAAYEMGIDMDAVSCRIFTDWWDNLTLVQAKDAVDLIWPEEKV